MNNYKLADLEVVLNAANKASDNVPPLVRLHVAAEVLLRFDAGERIGPLLEFSLGMLHGKEGIHFLHLGSRENHLLHQLQTKGRDNVERNHSW